MSYGPGADYWIKERDEQIRELEAEVERLKAELAKYVDPQSGIQYLHASEDEHYRRGRRILELETQVKRLEAENRGHLANNENLAAACKQYERRAVQAESMIEAALAEIEKAWKDGILPSGLYYVLVKALRGGREK